MANGNGKNNACCVITCIAALIAVGLLIWIVVKQNKCCPKNNFRIYSGSQVGTGEEEHYRDYDGVAMSAWNTYH